MIPQVVRPLSVPVAALLLASGGIAWSQEPPRVVPTALVMNAPLPREAVCAICGVREKSGPEPVAAAFDYQGKTYFFCQEACKTEFQKDPAKWIKAAQALTPGAEGVTRPAPKGEGEHGHEHGPKGVGPAGGAGGGQSAAPS